MKRFGTAALAAVVGLCVAQGARADQVYQYTGTVNDGGKGSPANGSAFGVTISLTDAAVQTGTYVLSGSSVGGFPGTPVYTSGQSGLNYFTTSGGSATPTQLFGSINLSLTFGQNDQITSDSIRFTGQEIDLLLAGTTGSAGFDFPAGCGGTYQSSGCTLSGSFLKVAGPFVAVGVPEPVSLSLLGAAVMGLAVTRRIRHG